MSLTLEDQLKGVGVRGGLGIAPDWHEAVMLASRLKPDLVGIMDISGWPEE